MTMEQIEEQVISKEQELNRTLALIHRNELEIKRKKVETKELEYKAINLDGQITALKLCQKLQPNQSEAVILPANQWLVRNAWKKANLNVLAKWVLLN